MHKPPVAPKPKLAQSQRPGLSTATPRRDGLTLPSPGTQRRVKPVLAPKPCLSKLPSAVESKSLASKSLHQTSVTEHPRTIGLLKSQNGIQQENKKPDWDYIIPICLCSQKNCNCITNTSAHTDKMEKDLKTLHKGKTEENRKLVPTSHVDNNDRRTDNAKSQVLTNNPPQNVCLQPALTNTHLNNPKHLKEKLTLDKNLNTDIDASIPLVNVRPRLPHRTLSNEANGNVIPQSAPGRGPEEDPLGSQQIYCVPQPKPVPGAPRKPISVPVPRKPRAAVLAHQEKVEDEKEESESHKGREMNVREMKVPLAGKNSSSMSVSVPVNESKKPVYLSARKACAPPAPPPEKKPFLSAPEKAPTFAHQTCDVVEEDLGWDSNIYEMEVSVDKEDKELEKEGRNDQEAVYYNLTHCPISSNLLTQPKLSQPPAITVGAEEYRTVKVVRQKPQRHSSPMARMQRKESTEEKEGKFDNEKRHIRPSQDCVFNEAVMRDLPLPPDEKRSRNLLTARVTKPSQSNPGKQKAKSFSGADIVHSEGQRRNSFRKLLGLKLSVRHLLIKGDQSPESPLNDDERSVDKDPDKRQNFAEELRGVRKLSCPLMGVEQSVDEDDFSSTEEAVHYENICHYDDIPDYMNVQVGKAGSSPRASFSQPTAWHSEMYNDEGIYEEQEPYIPFEKNTEHQQYQTQAAYDR